MTHFSTHEVAKILGVPDSRVRALARSALLAPRRGSGRRLSWSFPDLLLLKTARGLLDARVPARRVHRILSSLRRQLPEDRALSSVTVYADGRRVVAWDGAARWQPDSGQFLFNFDAQTVAGPEATRARSAPAPGAARPGPTRTAAEWFDLGCELDAASPDEARHAYVQAIDLDPTLTDAHVNLGRLYHQAGDRERAEQHYRAALRHAPRDAIAHFNLAAVLEERGRAVEAVQSYHQALATDADFADAHYNLGLLLDSLGRRAAAMTHLKTARQLYKRRSA
ncbi:MAG TPA: tetratricopeptide repeat protein [Candidatus Bathyarchaeia archaeon]|nr:tetratricopeptide repeat protein [Candidatus Bathyarchaeia archaeon]